MNHLKVSDKKKLDFINLFLIRQKTFYLENKQKLEKSFYFIREMNTECFHSPLSTHFVLTQKGQNGRTSMQKKTYSSEDYCKVHILSFSL